MGFRSCDEVGPVDGPVGEGWSIGQVELGAVDGIGLEDVAVSGAVRPSWCHLTPEPDWLAFVDAVKSLQ